jgi:hypothetical protein
MSTQTREPFDKRLHELMLSKGYRYFEYRSGDNSWHNNYDMYVHDELETLFLFSDGSIDAIKKKGVVSNKRISEITDGLFARRH